MRDFITLSTLICTCMTKSTQRTTQAALIFSLLLRCKEFVSSKGKWLSDPMRAKAITYCRSQGMVSSQRTSRIIEYFPKLYKLPLQCVIQIYNKRQTQNSFLSLLIIRKPYASFFLDAFCVFLAQIFPGNGDSETAVFNILKPPITARYIRILPIAWYKNIAMRIEIYGCTGNVLTVTNDANKKSNRGAF